MLRHYVLLSMILLAIVPFLVLDVHGQISLPPPANSSDSDYRPITVRSNTSDTGYLDGLHVADLFRDHKNNKKAIGDLFFQDKTYLLKNEIFKGREVDCLALVQSVKSLLDDKKFFPSLAIPDNITPNKKKDIVALGFDFYKNNRKHCSPNFDTVSTEPIITDKEFRVTIYDKSDKKPYYFSPRDNITIAQPIPACSSTNFDTSDKTLKGDTTMCYGTNGDDMVIITKRLAGFYGAANTVTSSDPVNLDLAPPPKPPTISAPSAPAAEFEHFNVTSQDGVSTGSFESPGRYTYADPAQGDIYIPQGTTILSNPILEGSVLCAADVWSISSILRERNVQGLAAPTNVVPPGALVSPAVGIDFRPRSNSSALCSPDLEAPSTDPLITSKELQVTLYDKSHKKPYYFSPRDSILDALPIPECSSNNYDETAQTLKAGTAMCYGINGTDIVIVTNRLAGFYGSADSINVSLQGLETISRPSRVAYGDNLGIQSLGSTVGGQFEDSGNFRHGIQRPNPVYFGHIYIPPFTTINSDSADFSDTGKTCSEARLRNTVTSTSYGIPPNTKGASNGFGFGFFQTADDTQSCTLKRIQMVKSHETNTTMYVTLYDQAGKKGFSYSPLDSDYKAIALPQCNLSNFNFADLTLLGDTKSCYHDNADDLVIFTKRLEWYGAATEINDDPATPNPNQRWTNFYIKSLGASNGGQVLVTDVSSTNDAAQSLYQAYMPLNAAIKPSPLLADNGQNCLIFKYSYDDDEDDFRQPNIFGAVTVNLIYKNGTDRNTCQSVNIDTVNAILKLNDTVRITLKGKSGLVPFYTDPIACNTSESNCSVKSGLVAADTSPENTANPEQLIPKCTSATLNTSTGKLIGSAAKCYTDDGTNLIIYTKNLEGYGAKIDPNTPYFYPPHSQFPTTNHGIQAFTGTPLGAEKGGLINADGIYLNAINGSSAYVGSVYIEYPTKMLPNPDLDTDIDEECIQFEFDNAPDTDLPNNTANPKSAGFEISTVLDNDPPCTIDLSASDKPLLLNREIRIQLDGLAGKKPFFISPREDITQAQPIPTCDNTNSYTNQTLKTGTDMCAADYDGHLIIISKRLGFYGAADSIIDTDPTSRYNVKGIGTNPLSDGLFNITTSAAGNGSIDASGKYSYIASGAKQKGHIYIAPDTIIYDDLFVAADVGKTCVQGHVIPSDYSPSFSRPSDVSDGTAYGFAGINGPDSDTCTLKLSHLVGQLNTSKTFQVVLYDQAGKVGYYYLRSIGINTAQDIAECSSTIFDNSTKTLKGTTRYCYKDVGGDLVIYAKVIQMYGAKTAGDTGANINTVSRDDVYGIGVNTNFNITTSAAGNGSIDTFGKYTWSAVGTQPKGHIYIPPDTIIYDDLFVADDVGKTCMQGRVIPSDYSSIISRPSDLSDGTAYGFLYLVGADSDTCTLKNTAFIGQFNTSNTLQVVLYDQAGKEGYYYHPGININTSQDMTKCSSTIFDDTTKTFKGTTKHCYADVGDDLVIYTKVLLWYGAKTPSTPDLLSIPKPSNFPQLQPPYVYVLQTVGDYGTLSRFQAYIVNGSYFDITDNDGVVLQAKPDGTVGNVYISGFTLIDNYTVTSDPVGSQCSVDLWSLSDLINKDLVPSFTIPDNISPSDQITGLGFDFNATNYSGVCKTDVESSTKHLTTRLDLRFTIYDSTGKQPYYFSPRENIVQARPIDPCTTDTIYTSNYTLKNTTEMCYGKDGNDLVILTKRLAFYGVEGSGDDGNSDSTDDDGDMANAPTFGTSPLTGEQLVTCGYKMDDTCRDITAYHVQYERDVIQTNTTHTFALKALAPNMIDSFTLAFGVPEVGSPVSAAEAYITAKLAVNYTSPSYYNIVQVTVHDPNNIIDYDIANTEIARVSCSGGTLECAQVTFSDVLFRETLYHEPFVVMITDTLLYTSINYMNEGILVTGTPLNEQPTISPGITVDTGDTRPTKLVLVRTDKVNDLWADAFGNTWSRNSFGNYVIVEYAPYAGTVPVCSDINDRLCAPFKAKLDWHNQRMIELRDSLYTAYTTEAYAEIDNIFAYEFGDMDSRTRTLINLGWLVE